MINLDKKTFVVKFLYKTIDSKFLVNSPAQLMRILKVYDSNGIEYIKEFDSVKMKAVRTSKESIKNWVNWQTEVSSYLKEHYYFN